MPNFQTDIYRTRDLAEATALVVMRRNLINIEKEGRICWFLFEDKTRCEEISHQFFFDTLLVNARDFHEAMSRLKNRLFAKG